MKISIVIATFNHLDDLLKPCCEALRQYCTLEDTEVIIVANGCTDGTRKYVESLGAPFKLLWFDEPQGFARANNRGIIMSQGDYVMLLNNDAFLLPQVKNTLLNMLLEPLADESVGITGPLMNIDPNSSREFMVFFCVMIRRTLFAKLGLLDEAFSVGAGEDIDFCIRAVDAGYKMTVVGNISHHLPGMAIGSAPIYHKGEATVGELPEWQEIFDTNSNILRDKYNY